MGRYVGIDPSTKTGFVILNDDGSVDIDVEVKPHTTSDPHRFMEIADTIMKLLESDDRIIIEGFSYGSTGDAVSIQYGTGWMMRAWIIKNGMDYIEVTPGGLKKFATGDGRTKKENMILPIYKKWGYEHTSDNVRDAYVMAQIGRYMDGLEEPTKYQQDVLKKLRGA